MKILLFLLLFECKGLVQFGHCIPDTVCQYNESMVFASTELLPRGRNISLWQAHFHPGLHLYLVRYDQPGSQCVTFWRPCNGATFSRCFYVKECK